MKAKISSDKHTHIDKRKAATEENEIDCLYVEID
jgi:hypothetical protein